ncbi:AAA-ATPase [Candidatus Magnetomorum sp. HK-1]|nr:AAA-ATPase [Candidatus Magnetomorum sp. HK-1]
MLGKKQHPVNLFFQTVKCGIQMEQNVPSSHRTYIGQNPTPMKNTYFVLHLDFSVIEPDRSIKSIESNFNQECNLCMDMILCLYKDWFQDKMIIDMNKSATSNLNAILYYIRKNKLPLLYVIIDEYDNFANQLIISDKTALYDELTGDDSIFLPGHVDQK